jgi:beta-galactosidase
LNVLLQPQRLLGKSAFSHFFLRKIGLVPGRHPLSCRIPVEPEPWKDLKLMNPPSRAWASARLIPIAVLALCCSRPAPLRAADRPASEGESRLSLDGPWRFTTDVAQDDARWAPIAVPGNWETLNEYATYKGVGWYRRTFDVPADWKGKHVRLRFEAVNDTARVWVNGVDLGEHSGGFTPFEFDVTGALKYGQGNRITVSADNTYRRGAWWPWGGISRSVKLIATGAVRVISQQIRAEPDLAAGTARVFVKLRIGNAGKSDVSVKVANAIEGVATLPAVDVIVPAGQTSTLEVSTELSKENVRLWHFDTPNLYRLTTKVVAADGAAFAVTDRFGIRKAEVKPDGFYLNGEKVRVNGFNRVHDHRALGNTEPLFLVKSDVDLMKRYGCILTRMMHAPLAPEMLDYLDEQGMMIFEEIPVWGDYDPHIRPNDATAFRWLREMVTRDHNHPCVVGWSVGNEVLLHYDYVKSAIEYTRKELDSSRLLSYVSHSGYRSAYTPATDPISVSDITLHNNYRKWHPTVKATTNTLRTKWPDKPIFYTEFGTDTFPETVDATVPNLEERFADLRHLPYVIGTSLWTFNDYRSAWKGSTPSQNRGWGVFDVWRNPKAAVRQVDKAYSPLREIAVADGQILLSSRTPDETPSFTLRDYYLKWEWLRPDGTVAGGGVTALPAIAPASETHTVPLGDAPPAGERARLLVSLITPTGHVVQEFDPTPAPLTPATRPAPGASLVTKAYPIDGGFFLGYVNGKGDKGVTIEYGTQPGRYTEKLTSPLPGATSVRGLKNGQTYYARLKRQLATGADAAWSGEVSVTPDGGLKPAAPALYGVVRGKAIAAVRFGVIDKVTGYTIHVGDRTIEVPTAAVGTAVVTGLEDGKAYTFSVTATNGAGTSAASNPVTAPPVARAAQAAR